MITSNKAVENGGVFELVAYDSGEEKLPGAP